MPAKLRNLRRTNIRVCQHCGSRLQPELRRKYDAFGIILLICLGAALAFYLVGLLIMAVGVWFWTRHHVYWVCPACSREPGTAVLVH